MQLPSSRAAVFLARIGRKSSYLSIIAGSLTRAILICNVGQPPGVLHMSPLSPKDIASAAAGRRELIEMAAFDLRRAASRHRPRNFGSRTHPWYIPQFAVLLALR
jgi:hypothetical protein